MSDAPIEQRVAALRDALTEKGHFYGEPAGGVNDWFEHEASAMSGATVVARAWTDPAYRERLLADGTAAIAELGISGPEGGHMVVVENTPEVHNVVVCTLCSCYPWPVLGAPPNWYKDARLPLPGRARTQGGAPGDGLRRPRRGGHPRVGQLRGGPLPRRSGAARGNGRPERGTAGRPSHA